MFRSLFTRLTAAPSRGAELFAAVVAEARRPAWYRDGGVPDTVDGRFAVLATLTALTMLRLERDGAGMHDVSAALAERFVEAMDAEHREMGLSDPTLGRRVRKLVSSLAARCGRFRAVQHDDAELDSTIVSSLYGTNQNPQADSRARALEIARSFRERLDRLGNAAMAAGEWG